VKCRMAPIFVARLLTQRKYQISIFSSSLTLAMCVSRAFTAYIHARDGEFLLFFFGAYYSFRVISPRQLRRDIHGWNRGGEIVGDRWNSLLHRSIEVSDARKGASERVTRRARCNARETRSLVLHTPVNKAAHNHRPPLTPRSFTWHSTFS